MSWLVTSYLPKYLFLHSEYQLLHIKALEESYETNKNILNAHKEIVKSGLEAIDKSFLGKLEKQLFKERFSRKIESQYQEMKVKMNKKKNSELKIMLDSLEELQDIGRSVLEQFDIMMEKMEDLSEKSTKDDGVYCELFLYLS